VYLETGNQEPILFYRQMAVDFLIPPPKISLQDPDTIAPCALGPLIKAKRRLRNQIVRLAKLGLNENIQRNFLNK